MCEPASPAKSAASLDERVEHLRGVIEREEATLHRRISVLVYKICGALRPAEVAERAQEILNEMVSRALQNAEKFEMGRSATAWLMGFAFHVLQEQLRGRKRRAVVQSDLGDAAWQRALEGLCTVDSDAAILHLDIRQALARLDEPQRRIVELRYFKGLDGEELARALNAPTAGAARVRLARALQALRTQFGLAEGEVTP